MVSARAKALLMGLPYGSISEDEEQRLLFKTIDLHMSRWPCLELAFHVPNGGGRRRIEAAILKGMGVKAGVSDIILPVARRGFIGLIIELKRADGTVKDVRKEQHEFLQKTAAEGHRASACFGSGEAWREMKWYVSGATTKTVGLDETPAGATR